MKKAVNTFKLNSRASVAHVGHTGTAWDLTRQYEALMWLKARDVRTGPCDFIDLGAGRDFLAETARYHVVVLHFIFRGGFGGAAAKLSKHPEMAISPLSGWGAWRRRLVQSGARFVFAFGGMAEVGGTFLCDLPGYKAHKVRTDDSVNDRVDQNAGLWIFEKE